jgi:hypothetical protein
VAQQAVPQAGLPVAAAVGGPAADAPDGGGAEAYVQPPQPQEQPPQPQEVLSCSVVTHQMSGNIILQLVCCMHIIVVVSRLR